MYCEVMLSVLLRRKIIRRFVCTAVVICSLLPTPISGECEQVVTELNEATDPKRARESIKPKNDN